MIEFCIIILPFLVVICGLVQVMLLRTAKMVVTRAANVAVRTAVVVMNEDPKVVGPGRGAPPGSRRHKIILNAASHALAAVVPWTRIERVDVSNETVKNAISSPAASGTVMQLLPPPPWLMNRIRIQLPTGTLRPREPVRLELTLAFPCVVPIVRRGICKNGSSVDITARAELPNQGANYVYGGN